MDQDVKIEKLDGGWDHITSEHIQQGVKTFKNRPIEEQITINKKKARKGKDNGMFGRDRSGEKNPRYGAKLSQEQKIKQSEKMKNRVVCKDKTSGKNISVFKDDPRFKTNELEPLHINKIVVKNKEGESFLIDKNDERILSGELIHINSGRKRTDDEKRKLSLAMKKLKWFNNGAISKRFEIAPDDSWVAGRLNFKK